jgi:hypothetical protein
LNEEDIELIKNTNIVGYKELPVPEPEPEPLQNRFIEEPIVEQTPKPIIEVKNKKTIMVKRKKEKV